MNPKIVTPPETAADADAITEITVAAFETLEIRTTGDRPRFWEQMMYSKEKIMDIAGFDIIKVVEDDIFIRYVAEKDGKAVTKELATLDAVRGELELLEARKSSEWVSEALPHGAASIVHPQSILFYALGKLLLRLLTLGKYPKPGEPHNVGFVTVFPGYVLMAIFVVITVLYS